jgi:hypothetical protein
MAVEGKSQETHLKVVRFIAENLSSWGVDVKGVHINTYY